MVVVAFIRDGGFYLEQYGRLYLQSTKVLVYFIIIYTYFLFLIFFFKFTNMYDKTYHTL